MAGNAGAGAGVLSFGDMLLKIFNVRVIGDGDKTVFLSHGFGTDQSVWNRIIPSLDRDHRIVLCDLACAGSVNPDHFDFRRYTILDSYADDLLLILDTLRIDRCFFVGHSISAMIGILASIRRPDLFLKLILIGASPRYLNDRDYHGGLDRYEMERLLEAMESNYEAWVRGFAPLSVGADVPAAVREFSRTLFNMRPDISLFVSRTVFNSDLRGVLGLVRVPCCIVQTERDVSVPLSVVGYLKENLGGKTTVEILPTEGHLPHLSAPAILAPVLRRLLFL
ncbi:probable strigolactone esterase DAD2 [Phalaenopsis equestris]|uniref:probable strigolactone esterase DAD2 n=1 Tax=Phalaenopsis equestris TaxID=78828 RepID=UPI0009E52976|nr:probable strigolactone esterase DAD2 [Phalaenopsis equestris]